MNSVFFLFIVWGLYIDVKMYVDGVRSDERKINNNLNFIIKAHIIPKLICGPYYVCHGSNK